MASRFTLRQLEYFAAVAEAGSISGAASNVNVSSPSISTAIAQLEREFGLSLFVRKHAHGLSLTRAGKEMLEQAKSVLNEARLLDQIAGNISGTIRGTLSLGCLLTFAQLIVPRMRRDFEQMYPDVRVKQTELHQLEIFSLLRQAKIDIALTYDLDIPKDLDFIPLLELPPFLLVNADHPLADQKAVEIGQLKDHPMVLLDLPHSNAYFLSLLTGNGVKPVIAERTKDMGVMRGLVANGFGYSIANIQPLNGLSPDGQELRTIPILGNVRPMNLGIVTKRGAQNSLTINAFINHSQAMIGKGDIHGVSIAT